MHLGHGGRNGLKHLEKKSVAVCGTEVAGMELYLEEKRRAGVGVQGSLSAGCLPGLLCAQGDFPQPRGIQAVPEPPGQLCSQPALSEVAEMSGRIFIFISPENVMGTSNLSYPPAILSFI